MLTENKMDELLKKAETKIATDAKYVKHIYGANEVGGTSWLYLSDVPFEKLGFKMNLERRSWICLPLIYFLDKYHIDFAFLFELYHNLLFSIYCEVRLHP